MRSKYSSIAVFIFVFILFCNFIPFSQAATGFDVGSLLLKVAITQGKVASKSITITSEQPGDYQIAVSGMKGVSLRESSFSLQPGKTKNVEVLFDAANLEPGVYVGNIKVSSATESSIIPIILEVDSEDVFFKGTLDIPPQYSRIAPGEKVLAQFKVFDLTSGGTNDGLGTTHLDVEYVVYTLDGNVVVSDSEDLIVDRQAQVTKTFSFPKDVKKEDYILAAIIKYKTSTTVSTNTFTIGDSAAVSILDFSSSTNTLLLIVGAIFVFFMIIIGLFIYFVRDRDKLLIELRTYHQEELNKMQKFLAAQENIISHRNISSAPVVRAEVKHKLEHLKRTHAAQEKHLTSLKSKGNVAEMRRKLDEWKAKGYNTMALDYKLKELSSKDMESLMSYWKRAYTTKDIKTHRNSVNKRR